MKYQNAAEVLPEALLRELQRYAPGRVLYIPVPGKRRQWGESSGARVFYRQRNEEIRERHRSGAPVEQLEEEYGLSYETIRKIVYK